MNDFLMSLPEDESAYLTERVNLMMVKGGRYDPFTADRFAEALISAEDPQFETMATLLRANDAQAFTAAVHLYVREFWFNKACRAERDDAAEELANQQAEPRPRRREIDATTRMFEQVSRALFVNQAH